MEEPILNTSSLSVPVSCIVYPKIPATFWKLTANNNRGTERVIDKLKSIVRTNKVLDSLLHLGEIDVRLRAFLCNMK